MHSPVPKIVNWSMFEAPGEGPGENIPWLFGKRGWRFREFCPTYKTHPLDAGGSGPIAISLSFVALPVTKEESPT